MSEDLILTNLVHNDEFIKRALPFLKLSYFQYQENKVIFEQYVRYYTKYNTKPTLETLAHEISELPELTDDILEQTLESLGDLEQDEEPSIDWLINTTEGFCQERAIYNAIQKSINIIDGDDEKHTKHAIPDILKKALSISFDVKLGHDYLEDAEKRFEFYNLDHPRIEFDIEMLNKITNGGAPRKTLNVLLGTTNVGKTLGLVHMATAYMNMGYNVAYITAEMSEEAIGNRVDANEFQINVNDIQEMKHDAFMGKIGEIKNKTKGRLKIHEYPTSTAHTGHIKTLLQEWQLKMNFVPDVIMIDYINIMASSRVKLANTGSYFYIKAIAEEFRALAVETNTVLWTATQSNRGGANNPDVDLTDTSESFGLPATADFMLALIRTEELDALGQLMFKQLKSRYGNKGYYEKFVIGSNIDTMSWYDVDDNAQFDDVIKEDVKKSKKGNFDDFKI